MKKLISSFVLGSVFTGLLFAGELETLNPASEASVSEAPKTTKTSTPAGWTDDMEAAKKQAAREGKLILADFSGSDWCGWCAVLDSEVFSKKEFLDRAKDKYVLVFVDSPQDKSCLSELAKKQNKKLVEDYNIRGFPTVLILDETGKQIAQTGYMRGGVKAYLEHLDDLIEGQKAIMRLEKEIRDMEAGTEVRVKMIHEAMKDLCAEEQLKHREKIEEVLAFDADGSAGMREAYPLFTVYLPLAENAREVSTLIYEDARVAYEKTTAEDRKNPDIGRKIFVDAAAKHVDELQACLKKIEAAEKQVPKGELNEWIRELKRQISMQLDAVRPTPAPKAPQAPQPAEGEEDLEGIFED